MKITIHKSNNVFISTGMIGVCVIALVQFSSLAQLTWQLLVAVFCFALAIPFLAGTIFVLAQLKDDRRVPGAQEYIFIFTLGFIFSYVGLAAIFFHFSVFFRILFLIGSFVAFFYVARSLAVMEPQERDN